METSQQSSQGLSPADVFGSAAGATTQEPGGQGHPSGTSGQPEGGRQNLPPPNENPLRNDGSPSQQQQSQQQAATAPAITPEMIAEAVKAGMTNVQLQVQAPPPPPSPRTVTPEEQAEFDRQFSVVRATPEMFKAILGVAPQTPEQLKAFENALHGAAKQAIAMSTYLNKQEMDKRLNELEQRYSQQYRPVLESHQRQSAQAAETEFFTAHQDLKDYGELVKEVALAAQAQKMSFKSREEGFKFVADRVRSLLGKAAPTGNNNPASSPSNQRRHTMTPLSGGGNPGTSQRSPQPGDSSSIRPQDVFKE